MIYCTQHWYSLADPDWIKVFPGGGGAITDHQILETLVKCFLYY